MAFTIANWTCMSPSLNQGQETITPYGGSPTVLNAPNFFTYGSPVDTVSQISAANYFLSEYVSLSVGDIIIGNGTDASFSLRVATVSSTGVTTVSMGLTTSIGTANITNGAVTSAKIASNVLQYAAISISAAQFNGMFATPVQLIAAQGANTLIVLDKVDLLLTYNSAAYAAGGVVAVQYANTANGAGVIASTTHAAADFQVTASTGFGFNMGVVGQTFSTCVNQGLFISNITGAFTTGNSAMVAHVWYKVIPTV